jgi:nicotinamidase-related amidase
MRNSSAITPFFIDDVADSQAAGRLMLMSIDHQFCMVHFDENVPDSADFDSYNAAHARSLHVARRHNVPVCHVLYDPCSDIILHDLSPDGRKLLRSRLQVLYQNAEDLTVRHTPSKATGHTRRIRHDLLGEVQDGDLVAFKDEFDAHSNPDLRRVLQHRAIDTQLYNGMISNACVITSMRSGMQAGRRAAAIGDAVEKDIPSLTDLQRLIGNKNFFNHCLPGSIVTDCAELDDALSRVLQPS